MHKATGSQGSWFAEVNGEMLPCAHQCFWVGKNTYVAPIRDKSHYARMLELANAFKEKGKAILTRDDTYTTPDGRIGFKRKGYIAVYAVTDVEINENHLQLKFIKRLCNLK